MKTHDSVSVIVDGFVVRRPGIASIQARFPRLPTLPSKLRLAALKWRVLRLFSYVVNASEKFTCESGKPLRCDVGNNPL